MSRLFQTPAKSRTKGVVGNLLLGGGCRVDRRGSRRSPRRLGETGELVVGAREGRGGPLPVPAPIVLRTDRHSLERQSGAARSACLVRRGSSGLPIGWAETYWPPTGRSDTKTGASWRRWTSTKPTRRSFACTAALASGRVDSFPGTGCVLPDRSSVRQAHSQTGRDSRLDRPGQSERPDRRRPGR